MKKSGKRQHYVQQKYLQGFACDSEKLKINTYAKIRNRIILELPIKKLAFQNHFYDIEIEKILDGKDDENQNIIDNFNNLGETFTDSYLTYYVEPYFASIQMLITQFRNGDFQKNSVVSLLTNKKIIEDISHYCTYQYLRTKAFRNYYMVLIKENIEVKAILESNSEFQQLLHSQLLFNPIFVDAIQKILREGIWILLQNEKTKTFYSSDNPISVLVDSTTKQKAFGNVLHVSYPLLPNLTLLVVSPLIADRLGYKQYENQLVALEEQGLTYFNKLQVHSAYGFVYSSDNNFEVAKTFHESQSHLSDKEKIEQFYSKKNI